MNEKRIMDTDDFSNHSRIATLDKQLRQKPNDIQPMLYI